MKSDGVVFEAVPSGRLVWGHEESSKLAELPC